MKALILSASAIGLTPALALAATWNIDSSHTSAQFAVKHMMVSNVRGEFGDVKGTVSIDDADVTKSRVEVTIDAKTVNTRDAKRDEHLRSPDFFDVAKHPQIVFKSKRVEKGGQGKLKVIGDLTMRGVTKEVALDVEGPTEAITDPWGMQRRGVHATAVLSRKDFGMVFNKTMDKGGVVVGDAVNITLDVELVRDGAETAKK